MSELVYQRDSKKPIYVSTSMYRALWILSKIGDDTPDALADGILLSYLNDYHPDILKHLHDIDKLEKELIKTIHDTYPDK